MTVSKEESMKTAVTIAGSDPSGGAGIQADIKTMLANGVYAMSVLTALTAQNTKGVSGIFTLSTDFIKAQMDAVFTDIPPDAVKIGMVSEEGCISCIAERLRYYESKNVVVDPVMIATSGAKLIEDTASAAMKKELFPLAALITPNIPEAEALTALSINCHADMEKAAALLHEEHGSAVFLKGGHRLTDSDDLFYDGNKFIWLRGEHIDNPNTHGTGCTLSSAIAANLAKGKNLHQSVTLAKAYVYDAIAAKLNLGEKNGPIDHASSLKGEYMN